MKDAKRDFAWAVLPDEALDRVRVALDFLWGDPERSIHDKVAGDFDYEELIAALLAAEAAIERTSERDTDSIEIPYKGHSAPNELTFRVRVPTTRDLKTAQRRFSKLADVLNGDGSGQWSTTPPTNPGMYWVVSRPKGFEPEYRVAVVRADGSIRDLVDNGSGGGEDYVGDNWEWWSEPLEPPK